MQIGFDAKRYFHNQTGLGNYARTILGGLEEQYQENQYMLYDEKPSKRTFSLGRMAEKDGCTVFHGLSNELPLDIKKTKMRSIVTIHDVAWRCFPDMYHGIDRKLFDMKYGWAARHADHVIAISHSTKFDIQHYYNVPDERISVIYQPVQELYYNPLPKDEAWRMVKKRIPHLPKDYMLSVGTVNSRKNLLATLKAMANISVGNRLPLVVVGNGGDYMLECRNYALEHLRRLDVHWLTKLDSNDELQALYTCATALLYPSIYEGFGLPVVEALLQKCPVLTSTHSSLPEAAGPGAILVDPRDIDAITDGISKLTDDPELRKKLATNGEIYCRREFDSRRLTEQLENCYLGR